jgi:hypothetical protein
MQCPGALPSRLIVGRQAYVLPQFGDNYLYSYPARAKFFPHISTVLGYVPRGGTVQVLDGPVCNDNHVWWKVNYNGRVAWTVEMQIGGTYWMEPM